jgi:glycolate oxidase iron-sulfur subunit
MTETQAKSNFSGADKPQWDDYSRCVHCGLCLNHCPTYRLWGLEADSPRGRIRQMLLVDEGRLELDDVFVKHIDQCLDCRACETACPSGVEYGKLVEATRAQIDQHYARPLLSRLARTLVFQKLLPHPRRIAALARMLRLYQRSGLSTLARATGILKLLGLAERERLLPSIDSDFFFSRLGRTYPAHGPRRARVAFFGGCLAQVTFTALNDATIRVLQANGCEVVVPAEQVCCGALCAHAGVRDTARELAQRNMDAFLRDHFDAIVTNAAGCGSTLKEYPQLLETSGEGTTPAPSAMEESSAPSASKGEGTALAVPEKPFSTPAGALAPAATRFSGKVRDVTEFLAELGLTAPLRSLARDGAPLRVTYQDSCHLAHGQKVKDAPRKLLRAIPGLELVEMPLADYCCGSAGVYNVTQTAASLAILADKMQHAASTRASVIATANPGCILQLRAGAALHATGQQVLHVVELLDRALATDEHR